MPSAPRLNLYEILLNVSSKYLHGLLPTLVHLCESRLPEQPAQGMEIKSMLNSRSTRLSSGEVQGERGEVSGSDLGEPRGCVASTGTCWVGAVRTGRVAEQPLPLASLGVPVRASRFQCCLKCSVFTETSCTKGPALMGERWEPELAWGLPGDKFKVFTWKSVTILPLPPLPYPRTSASEPSWAPSLHPDSRP